MSQAGWYPDPGGQQGMFRWWDGQAWTPHVTANQFTPPPTQVPGMMPIREAAPTGTPHTYTYDELNRQSSKKGPAFAVIIVGLLVVGLIFGGWYLLNGFRPGGLGGDAPASNPTGDVCPKMSTKPEDLTPKSAPAGRVQGGKLSYPRQGAPWGWVQPDNRVPFGRDAFGQNVTVERNYNGRGNSWVASLLVGELVAGDGFFSPQQGSEIVTRCVLGVFYGDAQVQRQDRVSQATTVDGKDAWVTEMHLSFHIPGLKETGETAIIVIVATGAESSSLYYASIPDSRPDLLQTAKQIQSQLRVES